MRFPVGERFLSCIMGCLFAAVFVTIPLMHSSHALAYEGYEQHKGTILWFYTPGDTVDNTGYTPEQPIPFSHKAHAGDRKIPCQYCHSAARRSETAGIPPLNTCMGCHKFVGTALDPIKFMTEKYNKNEPVEWVKVHDLPDFVRFTHKRHVAAGVTCQTCHGPVETMDKVKMVAPMQMGWCVDCHIQNNVSKECFACHY